MKAGGKEKGNSERISDSEGKEIEGTHSLVCGYEMTSHIETNCQTSIAYYLSVIAKRIVNWNDNLIA